jgi:uncharacterized protein YodC (DUF2158 family)
MSEKKYKVGDIVELSSGGPDMTVSDIDPDGVINCVWFVGDKKEASSFRSEAIQYSTKPAGSPANHATE